MSIYKISWLLVLCIFLNCFVPFSGQAEDAGRMLQAITVVSDDNYPPYIFRNSNGTIQGILVDEWALWEKKTGIKVNLMAIDWNKAQEILLNGQADVIDTLFFTEKRAELYDFTKPYATLEVPVFFNKNIGGIVDIASLQGLTIGVKAGDACIEILGKNGITSIKTFNRYEDIIQAAVDGQIKVFSIDKPPALYYLYKMNIENEFRYSLNLYTGKFHRAVKKGRTDTLKVVEDGFALITKTEHDAINKKWMGEPLLRPEYFLYISLFLLFVGLIFLGLTLFNIALRRNVRSKTSELQGAIHQLRLSEERYRILAEYSLQGIALLRGNPPVFVYVNPKWVEICGYGADEALSMGPQEIWNIVHSDDREMVRQRNRDRLMGKSAASIYEFRIIRKDGTTRWVEVYANRIEEGGEPSSQAAYVDITDRKQAEAEKLIAQKMAGEHEKQALVGQIAGKMAHDFNNILGIIMGNTELALLDCKEPKTKKTLELIYEQTRRGKNLTRNLVAFAKDQEPKQEFFRISEKIDLVLNLMRKDLEGIELRKEESPGVPQLLADPGMIEHALVNLIQNAIHALSRAESPRITVRTYSRDNHICFEIEDNGCGISQDNLEHIYDPSFTLKGSRDVTGSYKVGIKGTGYGMSNVKKYIEQHKGSISIESEFGSGTKFIIRLPIIKKELTIEEKTEIRKGKAHFEKYILLVEDETAIADVQYRILTQEPCNHRVDIANNGQVAMDLFGRNKYDLVSLDYVLPGDINGMDIYHHIRLSDKTIPILFISGNIEFLESIKELKQKDTAIDHLSKPNQNKDYINSINGLFERAWAIQQ